ncbi:MAG: small multi-drug export protein [Chloroflexi bacterium]|nr:small multi-drug export protein [Chloroflexota bacterium]
MSLEDFLWMFFSSAAPLTELRLSLPLAIVDHNIQWYYAFPVCFAGNLLPVPFLLLFLDPLAKLVSRVEIFRRLIEWVFKRTRRQGRLVEKYQRIGLVLVVAIPLPGTGAWTGAILAFLLGLEFKSSLRSIIIGVFIAAVIVTTLSLLGWIGALIAGLALITMVAFHLWRNSP